MTRRLLTLAAASGSALLVGWYDGWPEVTACGAGLAVVLLLALACVARPRQVTLGLRGHGIVVTRGAEASVAVEISSPRSLRGVRVLAGDVERPEVSERVTGRAATVEVPFDTRYCGERTVGPFTAALQDPWGIAHRSLTSVSGSALVVPRIHPVAKGLLGREVSPWQSESRRRGEDHFFTLRDYVVGDEPRSVHWRSSARAGKLVVKQHVASQRGGVLLVLDTEQASYATELGFTSSDGGDRFDDARDVAASLAAHWSGAEGLTLAVLGAKPATCGVRPFGMDAPLRLLASASLGSVPAAAGLSSLLTRTAAGTAVVVTGTPSPGLYSWLESARVERVLVRVGSAHRHTPAGTRVLDVGAAQELA